jgi:ribosomal protein S18 acetylase RimI-like enzyme
MIRAFIRSDYKKLKDFLADMDIFTENEKTTMLTEIKQIYLELKAKEREYFVVSAVEEGKLLGVGCYGIEDMNWEIFDIFWIVVHPDAQGKGVGKSLVGYIEAQLRKRGVRKIIFETSSSERYAPTRKFYEKIGYSMEAQIKDYFAVGDHKCIYTKAL